MSKQGARILVVDDEIEILRVLRRSLSAQGYQVFTVSSGLEVLEALLHYRPDLLLLDLGLPGMNGLEVCQQIRTTSQVPIIVLSVRDSEYDKVQALELGADDYIAKPFGIEEVLARVRVALRHLAQLQSQTGTETRLTVGSLEIDLSQRLVRMNERSIQFTPTEYDLLKVFLTHRGKILTRQMLLRLVWGENTQTSFHSLHVYIAQLRRKIEIDPNRPRFILTVPSIGYRFSEEDEISDLPSQVAAETDRKTLSEF